MLQNSLNIKKQTENMIEAYDKHDTVNFMQSMGSILRSVLDFDSYTSVSESLGDTDFSGVEQFMGVTKKKTKPVPPKFER